MVKSADVLWRNKISQFGTVRYSNASEAAALFLDILQALYQDLAEATRINLLSLLQEHCSALVQDQECAEQAVGCIKNLINSTQDKQSKLFIANCFITVTTIIIEFDLQLFNSVLVQDIIGIFMNTIKGVNTTGKAFLRKTACDCLLELESTSPLIIERYLNDIYKFTKTENSHAAQSYMMLFSKMLSNSLLLDKTTTVDEASDLLISEIIAKSGQQMASFISEDFNLLSSAAKWHIGRQISQIFACLGMPVNALISKITLECSLAMDLHALHLGVFLLLDHSKGSRSISDVEITMQSLLRNIKMPQFPTRFKFFCLRWFIELLSSFKIGLDTDVFSLSDNVLENIMPTMLDVPDLIREKLENINEISIMHPNQNVNQSLFSQVPLKLARFRVASFKLNVLYRVLYLQFVSAHDNEIRKDISVKIFQLTMENPTLISFTVDFISVVRNELLEPICCKLICKLVDFILKLECIQFMNHHLHYYLLLEHACCERDLWPMAIIKWLKKICVDFHICKVGDWEQGSSILLICRSILRTHTSVLLLQELADFLWFLHKRFNDSDVRDRALFYYSTIGHGSPQHYYKLFASTEAEHRIQAISKKPDIEISSNVMQGVLPTVRMDREFLSLSKVPRLQAKRSTTISEDFFTNIECYKQALSAETFDKQVYFELKVQHCKEASGNTSPRVYALTLRFSTLGPYKSIRDVHLPYLSRFLTSDLSSKGEKILLKFEPEKPIPSTISASVVFSNDSGRTCVAPIKPIQVEFSDLFNPFFGNDDPADSNRKTSLFHMLWQYCGDNQRTLKNDLPCAESVKRLVASREKISSTILASLQPFITSVDSDNTKIGIFLPPKYCVLMLFEIFDNETYVRFRVDNWELLSYVENYLAQACT